MGAQCVQGECTHRPRPAGAKKMISTRRVRPYELSGHGYAKIAQCVRPAAVTDCECDLSRRERAERRIGYEGEDLCQTELV